MRRLVLLALGCVALAAQAFGQEDDITMLTLARFDLASQL